MLPSEVIWVNSPSPVIDRELFSIHTRSAKTSKVWLGRYFAQNSLSARTQVLQECWSGPPPLPPRKCRFGQTDLCTLVELVWTRSPPSPPEKCTVGQILALSVELVWTTPPPQCRFGQILALLVELVWTTTTTPHWKCRFGQILAIWAELVWTTTTTPPPENADLDRSWHFGVMWELVCGD